MDEGEEEGNKVNGNANHARASSSSAEDKMDVDEEEPSTTAMVTQEEEQEIHEVLMTEAVKPEPKDASMNPEEPTREESTDVVMKEESEQGK